MEVKTHKTCKLLPFYIIKYYTTEQNAANAENETYYFYPNITKSIIINIKYLWKSSYASSDRTVYLNEMWFRHEDF